MSFCDNDVSKQSQYTKTIAVIKSKHVLIYNNADFTYFFKLSLNLCSYRLTSHSYQIITGATFDLSYLLNYSTVQSPS